MGGPLDNGATIIANELLLEGGVELLARTCLALGLDLSGDPGSVDEPIADYYRRKFVDYVVSLASR